MDARGIDSFRQILLHQREVLLREVANAEADLQRMAEERESELEEQAQEERAARLLARLDDRGKVELADIDRALARISEQRYGRCEGCGGRIARRRLAALPATPYCLDCAGRLERGELPETEAPPESGLLPPDYTLLTGRELEAVIRDQVRDDARIDTDELRIVCRHGVIYVEGSIPSEQEHQMLRRHLTDVMGLTEIVDHLQVNEILWERDDRTPGDEPAEGKPWDDSTGTDDVVEAHENGADFVPADRPTPEEE